MKLHRLITLLTYLLLLLGCLCIVHFITKIAEPDLPYVTEETETTDASGKSTPSDAESRPQESTPSDAWQKETMPEVKEKTATLPWIPPYEPEIGEPKGPPEIIFASDLHLLAENLFDGGEAFRKRIAADDGKLIPYVPQILDAFFDEVIEEKPDALVLGGDLTFYGEKESHLQLSSMLKKVEDAGIDVVLVPGNHDINTRNAKSYLGKEAELVQDITPEEFEQIYRDYGYEEAMFRDENSLSYIWELDESHWLMMLDSCQYEPRNLVTGRIKTETLTWMEERLKEAKEQNIAVLPIAHHNILDQSRLYTTECKMDDNLRVVEVLEEYRVPLFLSGHMHLQRIKKHQAEPGTDRDAYGISEIINTSFAMPPCQYGVLRWDEEGEMRYFARTVDVERWAQRQDGEVDENLLHFDEFSREFLREVMAGKVRKELENLPEDQVRAMTGLYAELYFDYCRGETVDEKEVKESRGYRFWERNRPDHRYRKEIDAMTADMKQRNFKYSTK